MADVKDSDHDAISSAEHSESNVPMKEVNEKDVAAAPAPANRRVISEWEAIQIAEAGDHDTIDREIAHVEADRQALDIKSTWFKPQLKLKDPRHFTWLLVGESANIFHLEFQILTHDRFRINGWSSFRCGSVLDQWRKSVHA